MKKEIADMWIQALESGEYKQNQLSLRNRDRFCCLGVLCNLHAQTHPKFAKKQTAPFFYGGSSGFLPVVVQKWAGMKSNCGIIDHDDKYDSGLSWHNDNDYSFQEIAQIIRKNWEKL